MPTELLHRIIFGVLYGCVFVLTFLVIERGIFFFGLNQAVGRIARALRRPDFDPVQAFAAEGSGVIESALATYVAFQRSGHERARIDDLAGALYLDLAGQLDARLWVLDTIVTAAPLLGLLGTILGIMQTFGALAASGTSDPGAVSRGIGTALVATALGIGTALYGLLGHNLLHRQAEHLGESFKAFLLRTTL